MSETQLRKQSALIPYERASHRVLRHHSKTKTGCVTCKERRVKCDETKPVCRRCTLSRLTCKGYIPLQTWLFDPDAEKQELLRCTPISKPEFVISNSRALQFFHERTEPLLRNFNSAADHFFRRIIHQVANREPVIMHQLVATAAAHELQLRTVGTPSDLAIKLHRNYQTALQILTDPKRPPSLHTALTSCLLFIALETIFRVDPGRTYLHVQFGLRMLREWKQGLPSVGSRDEATEDLIHGVIEPIFSQLEVSASAGVKSTIPEPQLDLTWSPLILPASFDGILEAREKFHQLGLWSLAQYWHSTDFYFQGRLPQIDRNWERWYQSFCLMRKHMNPCSDRQRFECQLLDVNYRAHLLTFKCERMLHEGIWDEYIDEHRDIVAECYDLIYSPHAYQKSGSLDIVNVEFVPSVIPTLWQVAVSCREPKIRREAISLLRAHHRRCGNTSSDCTAAVLPEYCVGLEERGLPSVRSARDIPVSRRVRPLLADFSRGPGLMGASFLLHPHSLDNTLTVDIPLVNVSQPPIQKIRLWPIGAAMRAAGYQGFFQQKGPDCLCKTYGTIL